MSDLGHNHIFSVFLIHPQEDGTVKRQLAGRYLDHDDEVHVLEDHFGVLSGIVDGPIDGRTSQILSNLKRSAYIDVVGTDDQRLDLIPETDFSGATPQHDAAPEPQQKPSLFEFERDGHTHNIEFRDGQCWMNGQHLDDAEAQRVLEHHQQGVGVLRYPMKEELAKGDVTSLFTPEQDLANRVRSFKRDVGIAGEKYRTLPENVRAADEANREPFICKGCKMDIDDTQSPYTLPVKCPVCHRPPRGPIGSPPLRIVKSDPSAYAEDQEH